MTPGKTLEMYFSAYYVSRDPRKRDEEFSMGIVLCKTTKYLQS